MDVTIYLPLVAILIDGAIFGTLLAVSARLLITLLIMHIIAVGLWSICRVLTVDLAQLQHYLTAIGSAISMGMAHGYELYIGALLAMMCFLVGAILGFMLGTKIKAIIIAKTLFMATLGRGRLRRGQGQVVQM